MSEISINKKGTILDESENFKPIHDNLDFMIILVNSLD